MEALTRIVADSLARHGFDRPVDPRRLQWSRWFRCDSPHSLLVVPSKPGIFALAEEIMEVGPTNAHVGTAALGCPAEQSSASARSATTAGVRKAWEGQDFSRTPSQSSSPLATEPTRRMLAVLQFSEDDDMAFTLDRMFTCTNPMRDHLATGRCFLRFVVIEDETQRRTICAALNQWMLSTAEKATGLPPDFQSSMELPSVGRTPSSATGDSIPKSAQAPPPKLDSIVDTGAARNLHCPHPLPSGF